MGLKLYLLRHGQTTFSRANAFCGSIDPELTEDGVAMAEGFAKTYHTTPWNAIYASPMKRAIATAQPLASALGIALELREGLKEINYGQWEGKHPDDVDRDYHDDYVRWTADPAWHAPTGGESAITIANRALAVVDEIRQRYTTGHVLVVSHKATIRIILCSLLGIDVGRFRYRLGAPVGSVSMVEFTAHGPLLHTLADRTHQDERLRSLPGT